MNIKIRLCSKEIKNCKECDKEGNDIKCTKCDDNYFFVNENYYNCTQKELISPVKEYYYDKEEIKIMIENWRNYEVSNIKLR